MSDKTTFKLLWTLFGLWVLYWAVRFWGHFPLFIDTMEYIFPEKWVNVEAFRQGRIPLLNPYLASGSPHLAAFQPAVFYPLFWLWNWTGLTDWFFVLSLLHSVLAAVGFHLWMRSLGVSPNPAVLCGMSFGASAFLVVDWGFPTHLASVAWVPWVLWASNRLRREPSHFWWWSLTCLFWAFQILAGYPFFTFYAGLFWAFCLLAHWKVPSRMFLLQAGAFGAALGLCACQWLPFLDFLGYLHREGWGGETFSLHWPNYLTLLGPGLLGTPSTALYKGDYPDFIFNNFYLGLVPLALFIAGFLPSAPWREPFWKWAALFCLLWPAGVHFWPWKILPNGWLSALEPATASFLFILCALTAVGTGWQERMDLNPRKKRPWKWVWLGGILWTLDVFLVPARVIQLVPDPYRDSRVLQAAETARRLTGEGRMLSWPDRNRLYSPHVATPPDAFLERAQELYPNINQVFGMKATLGYYSICTDGYQNMAQYLRNYFPSGRVLDASGTKLIVFPEKLEGFQYGMSRPQGPTLFTQNAGAMGHAWVTERIKEFPDRASAFGALMDPKAFLEDVLFTEKAPDGRSVVLPAPPGPIGGFSRPAPWERLKDWLTGTTLPTLRENLSSPCEHELMVKAPGPGDFLVLDEAFTPGWRAWVDGEPKNIFRVYGLWMAVPLSQSGDHQVVFRYQPNSVRLGFFISLLSLGTLAAAFIRKNRFSLD